MWRRMLEKEMGNHKHKRETMEEPGDWRSQILGEELGVTREGRRERGRRRERWREGKREGRRNREGDRLGEGAIEGEREERRRV